MKNLPSDIREAVDLLKAFERTEDFYVKPDLFREALEILELHLQADPESSFKNYISNVKKSYAKVFVNQLASLPEQAIQDEIQAYLLALDDLKCILDEIQDRMVNRKYQEFVEMWKEDFERAKDMIARGIKPVIQREIPPPIEPDEE